MAAASAISQTKFPLAIEYFGGHEVVAGEALVKFRMVSPLVRKAIERQESVDVSTAIGDGTVYRLHSSNRSAAMLVQDLAGRQDVQYAEPNYVVHADLTPNDPSFNLLWGMQNTGQLILGVGGIAGDDIKAPLAWDVATGNRLNVAAVVDTGIDYNHPDLAANIWTAPTSFSVTIGGVTSTCPAGAHGYNAITHTFDPLDDHNHGSHCSGTIGGVGNNGIGVAGVNWTASIMGCKFLGSSGSGTIADAVNAIEFAVQAKQVLGAAANVRVLSNSWGGGGFSQAFLDEMNRSNSNNMLFVCAAGNNSSNNDTTQFYPATYNTVNEIAVAATDNRDAIASFSNYGRNSVHLGAPGVNVYSTTRNNTYAYLSGTSMACPHVSGASLLLLSVNPGLTTAQLKNAIISTVDPVVALTNITITGGRLNVNRALRSIATDFNIGLTPASATIGQSGRAVFTANIGALQGFTGPVTFSASGQPAGVTASFSRFVVYGSGVVTGTLASTFGTPIGTYPITITGTSGSLTHSATFNLVVVAPAFTLSATPLAATVVRGGSAANVSVTSSVTNNFSGVDLSATGLPDGVTATFLPGTIQGNGTSTMVIKALASAQPGTYPVTITGTAGSVTRSTFINLTVQ